VLRNEGSETYVEIKIDVIKGKGQIDDLAFFVGLEF
jgi:hypothetical protein